MNAYLMEPFFAQILGLLFGIDKFPGAVTIIGVIAVTIATVMVNKGSATMMREQKRVIPALGAKGAPAAKAPDLEVNKVAAGGATGSDEELSHLQML